MNDSARRRSLLTVLAVGGLYLATGLVTAALAAGASAGYAALAVAFGAFGLAAMANVRDLGSAAGYRPSLLIALVAWPLLAAVPAFLVAVAAAAGLGLVRRGGPDDAA